MGNQKKDMGMNTGEITKKMLTIGPWFSEPHVMHGSIFLPNFETNNMMGLKIGETSKLP
jgi:hypothetical protein